MKKKEFSVTRIAAVVDGEAAHKISAMMGDKDPSLDFLARRYSRDGLPFVAILTFKPEEGYCIDFAYRCGECTPGDGGKEQYFENVNEEIHYENGESELCVQVCLQTFLLLLTQLDKSKLVIR